MLKYSRRSARFTAETGEKFRYTVGLRRGTQVVRERSAKPLYVGSIPTRASKNLMQITNVYAGFSVGCRIDVRTAVFLQCLLVDRR